MNTRQAIQPLDQPLVLNISITSSRNRFIVGLSEGCRLLRTDNCLTTHRPSNTPDDSTSLELDQAIGVAAALDDRYCAFAQTGRSGRGSPNVFIFWDAVLGKVTGKLDLHEPIIAIRLTSSHAAVLLLERTILLEYQQVDSTAISVSDVLIQTSDEPVMAPNKIKALHKTAANPHGLIILRIDMLVLPAQAVGQVQIIPLPAGSKRVFKAHNTQIRALAVSDDGKLIATSSVQGTLIRVFDTITLDQVAEFRRGMDQAIIYTLAISPGNRWIACTSDKGTLHMFDMRPEHATTAEPRPLPTHRRSGSIGTTRPASAVIAPSLHSTNRSSPPASVQYQGSVQEYYGLLPPPSSASPTSQAAAISALAAFKNSSLAPKVLKDTRSIASARFWMGNEPPHWQGGASHAWTTAPDGTRKRVRNAALPLADDPDGKPPKGVLCFAPDTIDDDDGAIMYIIGGGSDARWERFELAKAGRGGSPWILSNMGYRRYLTRQFTD